MLRYPLTDHLAFPNVCIYIMGFLPLKQLSLILEIDFVFSGKAVEVRISLC